MTHLKHSVSPSVRGPYLPTLKGSPLADYFDYDRFFHSPWGHNFPPVNVKENIKSFEIELMVPGYNKMDFNISMDEEFLTVSAEGKHEDERKEDDYTQKQFGFIEFSRSFHLPPNACRNLRPNAANTRTMPTFAISRSQKWCLKNRTSAPTTTATIAST